MNIKQLRKKHKIRHFTPPNRRTLLIIITAFVVLAIPASFVLANRHLKMTNMTSPVNQGSPLPQNLSTEGPSETALDKTPATAVPPAGSQPNTASLNRPTSAPTTNPPPLDPGATQASRPDLVVTGIGIGNLTASGCYQNTPPDPTADVIYATYENFKFTLTDFHKSGDIIFRIEYQDGKVSPTTGVPVNYWDKVVYYGWRDITTTDPYLNFRYDIPYGNGPDYNPDKLFRIHTLKPNDYYSAWFRLPGRELCQKPRG